MREAADQPSPAAGVDAVTVIRMIYEAFNVRDLDTVVALTHPDVELRPLRTQSRVPIRGRDAFQAWLEDGVAAGRTHRYQIDRMYEQHDGSVILTGTMNEHDASLDVVAIHHLEDGLSWRVDMYFSDEQMLHELGVLE